MSGSTPLPSNNCPFRMNETIEPNRTEIDELPRRTVSARALPPPLVVPTSVTFGIPLSAARNTSVALKHFSFISTTTGFE